MMFYANRMRIVDGAVLLLLTILVETAGAVDYYSTNGVLYINPDSGSSRKPWSESQSFCKSLNSTLCILDTPNKRLSFIEALKHFGLYNTDTWVGAIATYGCANGWRWINRENYTGPAIQAVSDFIHSFITISKPETSINVKATSAIYSFNYLCQYPASSSACASGSTWLTSNGFCYVASNDATTWFSARNNCLSNGGDLAIFPDLNLISQYLTSTQYWIGLRSSWWNWQNAVTETSTDVTFSFWANDQPNDDSAYCMSFTSGKQYDDLCYVPMNFICQKGVESNLATFSTASPKSSSPKPRSFLTSATSSRDAVETSNPSYLNGTNDAPKKGLAMAIGIAVGIGVPVIAIIIIVIVVIVICRRRNNRKAEEQNSRDQSVSLPQNSLTPPTYVQLNMADRLEQNEYATIGSSADYTQPEERTNDSGFVNLSELSPYATHIHMSEA